MTMNPLEVRRTKIIVYLVNTERGYRWRAPLITAKRGNLAHVELRPTVDYESEESARSSGERFVRALFPDVSFD
jgi:hypothetical protein